MQALLSNLMEAFWKVCRAGGRGEGERKAERSGDWLLRKLRCLLGLRAPEHLSGLMEMHHAGGIASYRSPAVFSRAFGRIKLELELELGAGARVETRARL